ncbi:MAG: SpoIID/LytB domain-containing protein [Dehalococcoidales bacterium]
MIYKILLLASIFMLISGSFSCGTQETSVTSENTTIAIPTATETLTTTQTQTATATVTQTQPVTVTETKTETVTVTETAVFIRVKRESHGGGQIVTLNMETEYLPVVVACENPDAPYESLKAQAVASRTFAFYKMLHEPRSDHYDILDSELDQVYNPATLAAMSPAKQASITQAVKDTKGLVIRAPLFVVFT